MTSHFHPFTCRLDPTRSARGGHPPGSIPAGPHGRPVIDLTETETVIRGRSGANLTYRRHNEPALRPLGDSLDDWGTL
jgi:hypothetical protein